MNPISVDERLNLQELTHLYSRYVDAKQVDKVMELFTDDGVFDETRLGAPVARGKPELRKVFQDGFDSVSHMIHYVTNHIIDEYSGSEATGQCFVQAEARLKDGSPVRVFGYYEDKYVKVDGRWRFRSRRVVPMIPPELSLK